MVDKGRTLGEFVVEEKIAAGGMGEIYRAVQPSLEREAVVKVLRVESGGPAEHERFLQEARLASKLDHPYAAHVYASGAEEDGILWIAMELVRGVPLDHMIKQRGGLPTSMVVPLVEKIAEVLDAAHHRGIIHRDLKPANVMVVGETTLFPKLLDFGIAKLAGAKPEKLVARTLRMRDLIVDNLDTVRGRLTDSSVEIFGSPRYMPPEQWANPAEVGTAADVYALGVLTYEALAGKPPFSGDTFDALRRAHESTPVPPIPGVAPGINAALARALAKKPEDRYACALDLARDLRLAIEAPAPEPAPPPAPTPAPPPPPPRRRWWLLAPVLLGGAALAVVVVRVTRHTRASVQPDLASLHQLTHDGACVYSPVFVDAHTIVADVARDDADDLWKIDATTGEMTQLTSDPGMEYRPAPGPRPGSVLFVDAPRQGDGLSSIDVLGLDGKREVLPITSHSAWFSAGAIVYAQQDAYGIRVRQGDHDDLLVDTRGKIITVAASERIVAASVIDEDGWELCQMPRHGTEDDFECESPPRMNQGRPAIAADGAIYFGTADGVRRSKGGISKVVIPGLTGSGGSALSLSGDRLVTSECHSSATLIDLAAPDRPIAELDEAKGLSASDDAIAFTSYQERKVSLLTGDKKIQFLAPVGPTYAALSPSGKRFIYTTGGDEPELWNGYVDGREPLRISRADIGTPYFLDEDRIAYTRHIDATSPKAIVIATFDGQELSTGPVGRMIIAARGDELLISDVRATSLYTWNVGDAGEQPIPMPRPGFDAGNGGILPDGTIVLQSTSYGDTIWELPPGGEWKQIFKLPVGETSSGMAVTPGGRIIVSVNRWKGELFEVKARAGSRF
jgi:serine/threonine-protein kinase